MIKPNNGQSNDVLECSFVMDANGERIPNEKELDNILVTATILHKPFMTISQLPSNDEDYNDCSTNDDSTCSNSTDEDSSSGMSLVDTHMHADESSCDDSCSEESNGSTDDDIDTSHRFSSHNDVHLPPHKLLNHITSKEIRLLPQFLYIYLRCDMTSRGRGLRGFHAHRALWGGNSRGNSPSKMCQECVESYTARNVNIHVNILMHAGSRD